jgi:RNA polymerase sigma-70 factor, ECF subfamily
VRRERTLTAKRAELERLAALTLEDTEEETVNSIPDERLALIFTCCHPALAVESQVALTLRLLGGLTTAEIAAAFLTAEPTMAQRLVRAKQKIRDPVPRPAGRCAHRPPGGRARDGLPDLQRGLPDRPHRAER